MRSGASVQQGQDMATLWSVIVWIFGTLLSVLYWILSTLFWMFLWFFLPLVIVAFLALRIAENVLGQERVRGWVMLPESSYRTATAREGAAAT